MKTLTQRKVADWLDVSPATLSNRFHNRRGHSRAESKRLAKISGLPFEDWMLSDGEDLKKKVFIAWTINCGGN